MMKMKLIDLAQHLGGTVVGDGDVDISGLASIDEAKPGQIAFIEGAKQLSKIEATGASAVIVPSGVTSDARPLLVVTNPRLAFARALALLTVPPYRPLGVDPRAAVSPTAVLGKDLSIHPFATVGEGCRIGDRVTLYPGAFLGNGSSVGDDSVLHPNVSVYAGTRIGNRVILHSGVVVGSDGFGYVKEGRRNVKIPQVGTVEIEDDVEVGANTTIDRATLGKTVIRRGVKIDNLVQVAHNVVIGEDSIIVAQVGISGSTRVGNNVTLGGQVGLTGHIEIGDNVMVGAQSGVPYSLAANAAYTGSPALPHREFLRMAMALPKVPEMRKALGELEKRLSRLEGVNSPHEKEKE
jgi:UDP-3-O-[3-hydroxymyristoyl] glucosamine N-acyltransferase